MTAPAIGTASPCVVSHRPGPCLRCGHEVDQLHTDTKDPRTWLCARCCGCGKAAE